MFYRTGDIHGGIRRIRRFAEWYGQNRWKEKPKDEADVLIILGDAGFNYYGDSRDDQPKAFLQKEMPFELFLVHGNHEKNPEHMSSMKEIDYHEGIAFYEEAFPSIIYGKDGEIYDFDGKRTLVLGGAYSVDKEYRLLHGYNWFEDEQMDGEVRGRCLANLDKSNWNVDIVLSHTVPLRFEPVEDFISGIDQSKVDKTTEIFLQEIQDKLRYERWFAGHYHCDKRKHDKVSHKPPVEIMFREVQELLGHKPLMGRVE